MFGVAVPPTTEADLHLTRRDAASGIPPEIGPLICVGERCLGGCFASCSTTPIMIDNRVRDIDLGGKDLARTMQRRITTVTPLNRDQATIVNRRIGDRQPNRQHVGAIGRRGHNCPILMPQSGCNVGVGSLRREQSFRRLDTRVLHRIGVDIRTNHGLNNVENPLVGQQVENGAPSIH